MQEDPKDTRAAPPRPLTDSDPLSEAELRDAEGRIQAARRLARKIGLAEASELGRLVAEVRSARKLLGEARDHLRAEHQCASDEPAKIDAFLRSDSERSESNEKG